MLKNLQRQSDDCQYKQHVDTRSCIGPEISYGPCKNEKNGQKIGCIPHYLGVNCLLKISLMRIINAAAARIK